VNIRNIPVDVGRLAGFACTIAPSPIEDRESGQQRMDRESGLPLYQVGVTVRVLGASEAEVLTIQVPGEPVGVLEDERVRLYGLSVQHWNRDGRSGLTYRATAITHANAPAPVPAGAAGGPPSADPTAARIGGGKAATRE
jgi:hypothetical protein